MDYTHSDALVIDSGTGHAMHQQDQPITTEVSAEDMNAIIWSLMEVVTAGGQTAARFDKATPLTYQKLRLAIQALAAEASPVLASGSNFQEVDGGRFFMWGTYTGSSDNVSITFPTAFPTECFGVAASASSYGLTSTNNVQTSIPTTTGFTLHAQSGERPTFWLAIGA